ncbi:tetratricopeptide repeat protein, partial [Chamaesiphon sp. OTE_75_metabat_556]|uniref:tetratricopeptide repeat protein n=1 Tax=Chamaesiphon sp. OTE_75_metabat_556 TaxID=2964692 RepID=UPI0037BE2CCA
MHLFHDICQSITDDLNTVCDEVEDFLFADWYAAARLPFAERLEEKADQRSSKTACKARAPRTLADYNLAIQSAPTDANLFYGRGTILHRNHDHLGAIADYNLAVELNPHLAAAYAARAISYIQIDRLTDAIADCDRAIELHPDLQFAHHTRAVARSYSGDNTGAIADFTRCTQLAPSAAAYYNLGVTQLTIDLYTPALASLSKSLDLRSEIATYYARSVALAGLGDEFGTNRDYSAALSLETPGAGSLYPNDEHAYYFRALARLAKSQREQAKADLQTTIAICDRHHNTALRQLATAKIAEID